MIALPKVSLLSLICRTFRPVTSLLFFDLVNGIGSKCSSYSIFVHLSFASLVIFTCGGFRGWETP